MISVTVDLYRLVTAANEYHRPWHKAGQSETSAIYYDKESVWCFSAGYFQILCPQPEVTEGASYYLTVTDSDMQATSIGGTEVREQSKKDDDLQRCQFVLTPRGSYSKLNFISEGGQQAHGYSKNLSTSVTGQGADGYTTQGSTVEIWGSATNGGGNDIEAYPYAINIFQKFDDRAFQPLNNADGTPTAVRTGADSTLKWQLRYAANQWSWLEYGK